MYNYKSIVIGFIMKVEIKMSLISVFLALILAQPLAVASEYDAEEEIQKYCSEASLNCMNENGNINYCYAQYEECLQAHEITKLGKLAFEPLH